ncbi:MAG: cupin domain-containing protein [bacterium]
MSSLHRAISGDILVQHLAADAMTIDAGLLAKHGRSARTLVKEGALRLTLMALAPGGRLPAHSTDNPISIHVVQGDVTFYALDQDFPLTAGDVLIFAPRVEHAARSVHGSTFLLTVAHTATSGDAEPAAPPPAVKHSLNEAARQRWMDDGGHPPASTPASTPASAE